jgi:hypothetical protein
MADVKALLELVRQGERVIDHQVQQSDVQDEKSRQLITLVTGLLAAAAVGSGWLARLPELDLGWLLLPFVALVVGGVLCSAVAFRLSTDAYLGARGGNKLLVGWGGSQLKDAALADDAHANVLKSTLMGMKDWTEANVKSQEAAKAKRVGSFRWLFAAGACLVVAYLYAAILVLI